MLKERNTILLDLSNACETKKEFFRTALRVIGEYDENFLIKERAKLMSQKRVLLKGIQETNYFGMNAILKKEIRIINKKLKTFKYLLI